MKSFILILFLALFPQQDAPVVTEDSFSDSNTTAAVAPKVDPIRPPTDQA